MPPRREKTEFERARDRRSLMIALACGLFVILVFTITILRLKGGSVAPHF